LARPETGIEGQKGRTVSGIRSAAEPETPEMQGGRRVVNPFAFGATTGIGSLPHRDPRRAAVAAFEQVTLPYVPTLPRRSPAEGMMAQAVSGLPGVSLGQYGSIALDVRRFEPDATFNVNLESGSFGGLRAFLDLAVERRHRGPVKWQFVGPVTLGIGLVRAGAPIDIAFRTAVNAVRAHLLAVSTEIASRLPACPQLVLIDEPWLGSLMDDDFAIAPDTAVDLISEAMAVAEKVATVGVHCCADADLASLLATGPKVLSIPSTPGVLESAGYLTSFLESGGIVAWGAVATGGPILTSAERCWRDLCDLWCHLVERGCDPVVLRTQSLVTPACGLGLHSVGVSDRVFSLAHTLGTRVRDQVRATQYILGG
jgi:hypothetical protein